MYFPASHLSHSPSLASSRAPPPPPRVSEYSPLLSFPNHLDDLAGLSSSSSASLSSSTSTYLKLFSLILVTVLALVITGVLLFHRDPEDEEPPDGD